MMCNSLFWFDCSWQSEWVFFGIRVNSICFHLHLFLFCLTWPRSILTSICAESILQCLKFELSITDVTRQDWEKPYLIRTSRYREKADAEISGNRNENRGEGRERKRWHEWRWTDYSKLGMEQQRMIRSVLYRSTRNGINHRYEEGDSRWRADRDNTSATFSTETLNMECRWIQERQRLTALWTWTQQTPRQLITWTRSKFFTTRKWRSFKASSPSTRWDTGQTKLQHIITYAWTAFSRNIVSPREKHWETQSLPRHYMSLDCDDEIMNKQPSTALDKGTGWHKTAKTLIKKQQKHIHAVKLLSTEDEEGDEESNAIGDGDVISNLPYREEAAGHKTRTLDVFHKEWKTQRDTRRKEPNIHNFCLRSDARVSEYCWDTHSWCFEPQDCTIVVQIMSRHATIQNHKKQSDSSLRDRIRVRERCTIQ